MATSLPGAPLLARATTRCSLRPSARPAAPPRSVVTNRSSLRAVAVRFGVDEALRSESKVEAASVPRSVPVRVAYELHQAGHRYIDVRTEGEFSAGHPQGAVNIPYMNKTGSGMTKNTHFLEQVSRIFGKDDEIVVVSLLNASWDAKVVRGLSWQQLNSALLVSLL
ncbi:protein HIGH ARSENIC CONTENT 1, mitochondrial-like isoform X2 [Panicum virgatum]|uniref:protein HIGH ARSENIC CONTENT 1, mitochondrial-like isoform X2 n=1 Tax=Panicum virgatum TaxID=38727 RepID=UPI0019D672A7|nr:protein HIGH ARSENIC CONTENT 1, mitochondrial-like isoform X2 [Panicum virgatum]